MGCGRWRGSASSTVPSRRWSPTNWTAAAVGCTPLTSRSAMPTCQVRRPQHHSVTEQEVRNAHGSASATSCKQNGCLSLDSSPDTASCRVTSNHYVCPIKCSTGAPRELSAVMHCRSASLRFRPRHALHFMCSCESYADLRGFSLKLLGQAVRDMSTHFSLRHNAPWQQRLSLGFWIGHRPPAQHLA